MKQEVIMEVDLRKHEGVRRDVHAGLKALLVQGRQIWGAETKHGLRAITERMMVGVGDIARLSRDGSNSTGEGAAYDTWQRELKKELGNIVFSTIRWIDDLGLDPLECLDLAIEAQEKFAQSGRPR